MKISHESPICLLDESRRFNDYDYALVHLFEEHPKYYEFFKKSVEMGREVLLDNSIFELGVSFDPERFAYWIKKLKPTSYIIPDVLEDVDGTMTQAYDWFQNPKYASLPGKRIGVLQGKTYEEIVECYKRMTSLGVDSIAISFDYSMYETLFPHPIKLVSWCFGRVRLINELIDQRVIDYSIPVHLLGCSSIMEFSLYRDEKYSFIKSLDTSNPITLSLDNSKYTVESILVTKPKTKLFQLIDTQMTENQYKLVLENTSYFRQIVNG